jgi:hypothetical protein
MFKFKIIFYTLFMALAFQENYVVAGEKVLPIRAGTKRLFAPEEDTLVNVDTVVKETEVDIVVRPMPKRLVIKGPPLGIRSGSQPLPNNIDLIKVWREQILFFNYFQTMYHGHIIGLILRRCERDAYGTFLPDVLGGIGLLTQDLAISSNPRRYVQERVEAVSRLTLQLKSILSTLEMIDIPELDWEESYRGYSPDTIRELRQRTSEIQEVVDHCPVLTPFFSIYNELKRVSMLLNRLHDYKI